MAKVKKKVVKVAKKPISRSPLSAWAKMALFRGKLGK